MLDAYMKGMWVNLNGNRFYYSYDAKRNDWNYQYQNMDETRTVHCFMDFNVENMVCTQWHLIGNQLFGIDEILIPNNADTAKMAQALINRGYTPDRTILYPDPAGNQRSTRGLPDIQILRNAGFHQIKVKPAHPTFRQRQLNVNNALEKGWIHVDPIRQPTLKRDLLAVEQDTATNEKVKKNPKLTHASDGLDYGCDFIFPFSGQRSLPSVVKFR
jgi:hypothetical protein